MLTCGQPHKAGMTNPALQVSCGGNELACLIVGVWGVTELKLAELKFCVFYSLWISISLSWEGINSGGGC